MLHRSKSIALSALIGLGFTASWAYAKQETAQTANPSTQVEQSNEINEETIQRLSEAFGHLIGENLDNPGLSFHVDSVIQGIRNAVDGKPSPMSEAEYAEEMAKLQRAAFDEMANENLSHANTFMQENAGKDGVTEIEVGKLQYEVLNEGAGAKVLPNSAPTIHYVGTYSDGTVFGSSEDGGGPITLPLDQTIAGFNKGLIGMKEGEKRRLYIHPDLGYGTNGHLPPNSLLIFDIEVLSTNQPENGDVAETPELAVEAEEISVEESAAQTIADINESTEAIR